MPVRDNATEVIVVIEDDPSISELLQLYLTREGYSVIAADQGAQGV